MDLRGGAQMRENGGRQTQENDRIRRGGQTRTSKGERTSTTGYARLSRRGNRVRVKTRANKVRRVQLGMHLVRAWISSNREEVSVAAHERRAQAIRRDKNYFAQRKQGEILRKNDVLHASLAQQMSEGRGGVTPESWRRTIQGDE